VPAIGECWTKTSDVRTYIVAQPRAHPVRVPGENEGEFVDVLTTKNQDNFIYLVYVLADFRAGKIFVDTIDSSNKLPVGLRAYYEQPWATLRAQDQDRFERNLRAGAADVGDRTRTGRGREIRGMDAGPAAPGPGRDPGLVAVPQRNA
jgi:hypothetical protein